MNISNQIIAVLAIILTLMACDGLKVSKTLDQIDSLVVKEKYDSAYVLLNSLESENMTKEEQAHYNLILSQLGFITHHPLPTDSLLNTAITYYNKVGNHQKLAETYYYKSLRSELNGNYTQAILHGKKAELQAFETDDKRLLFKVTENLAYLNGLCNNNALQLLYAKKALDIARKVQNKNWIAYSYNNISFAYRNLGQYDSAIFYIEKSIPYTKFVYDSGKPGFLTNIGLLYKDKEPEKAKMYFKKALAYVDIPEAIVHLADIYYFEGNKKEAYNLWKKAITIEGIYDKINLISSIISYDLEHGNVDEVSRNVDEIIHIKDSILNKLKNDTIKDLQLRFDHEVAMHEADVKLGNSQKLLLTLVTILILMAFYIYYRKKNTETREKGYQEQLFAYTTEINQLTETKDRALTQIGELESHRDKDGHTIAELNQEVKNAELKIEELNKSIKNLLDDKAQRLKKGRVLYDHIIGGGNAGLWTSKEEALFDYYYSAINYQSYNRLNKVERVTKTNAHNMFYLILKEIGYSDDDVKRIMAISPEGLRSLRNRTKPISQASL